MAEQVKEKVADSLYVSTHATGLGEKKARGKGSIGMRKQENGLIEFSIGRSASGWSGKPHVSAWATMSPEQAHELAMAISYLTQSEFPCQGAGLKVSNHKVNLSMNLTLGIDLCTLISKKEALKEEILKEVAEKLEDTYIQGLGGILK